MSTPWYVSDSFTIDAFVNGAWHYPGPFNMEHTWGVGQPVTVEWSGGELSFIVFSDTRGGCNGDVYLGLYDIGGGAASQVPDSRLKFLTVAGAPMAEAVCMNSVARNGVLSLHGSRYLPQPIRLGGVTTPATGGPFQLGAHMRFFGADGVPLSYQYFLQGSVPAFSPPPSSSNLTLTTPTGVNYSWPATSGIWTGMA